jgi:hypothetical protein
MCSVWASFGLKTVVGAVTACGGEEFRAKYAKLLCRPFISLRVLIFLTRDTVCFLPAICFLPSLFLYFFIISSSWFVSSPVYFIFLPIFLVHTLFLVLIYPFILSSFHVVHTPPCISITSVIWHISVGTRHQSRRRRRHRHHHHHQ